MFRIQLVHSTLALLVFHIKILLLETSHSPELREGPLHSGILIPLPEPPDCPGRSI